MDWKSECAVVIPCHNEAACIGALVGAVRAQLPNVIVVDDGSTDATASLATGAGAEVVSHSASRGKGAALKSGWARARERGFVWALAMDGDGQHAPADIQRFLDHAEKTGAALVIGNRLADPRGMPRLRLAVNRWMSRRLSRLAGRSLPDSQCGFRLMRLDVWSGLKLHTDHFQIESEMLLAFVAAGAMVEFVPIQVIYRGERSKIRPWRDTWRWFAWLRSR